MDTMLRTCLLAAGLSAAALLPAFRASAADKWWPLKVYDSSSGKQIETEYEPLAKADKRANICVLFPHMKDSFWVAVAYGIVQESQRLGVNMNLYEAGGYENLPRQLSQFDDCLAGGSDAIVIGAISEAGLSQKFAEAKRRGIPVIGVTNPTTASVLPAMVFVDFKQMGAMSGKALIEMLGGKPANLVTFPGPAGSGWAESFNDGFKGAVKATPAVKVLGEKFGDTGVAVQLQLIQDALQAYPDMNVIWGSAPTAEAAIGAVAEAGKQGDITIISSYENQALLDALKRGDIAAFATQFPVAEGRIAIDQTVRVLEKKPVLAFVQPIPQTIEKSNVDKIDMSLVLAPASWTPVYRVSK